MAKVRPTPTLCNLRQWSKKAPLGVAHTRSRFWPSYFVRYVWVKFLRFVFCQDSCFHNSNDPLTDFGGLNINLTNNVLSLHLTKWKLTNDPVCWCHNKSGIWRYFLFINQVWKSSVLYFFILRILESAKWCFLHSL